MLAESIKPAHWVIARIQEEIPRYGYCTVHNESGRIYRHIHNHDVAVDRTETFDLAKCRGRDKCAAFIVKCREHGHISHLLVQSEGALCVAITPIRHVSNHIVAERIATEREDPYYISRKKTSSRLRRADRGQLCDNTPAHEMKKHIVRNIPFSERQREEDLANKRIVPTRQNPCDGLRGRLTVEG